MAEDHFKEKEKQLRSELESTIRLLGRHFSRTEAAETAGAYRESLLSRAERKNTWQMAEAAGRKTPYAFQHLLGRSLWSEDDARDDHVRRVMEGLGSRNGILVVDETGFLKKGEKSGSASKKSAAS